MSSCAWGQRGSTRGACCASLVVARAVYVWPFILGAAPASSRSSDPSPQPSPVCRLPVVVDAALRAVSLVDIAELADAAGHAAAEVAITRRPAVAVRVGVPSVGLQVGPTRRAC